MKVEVAKATDQVLDYLVAKCKGIELINGRFNRLLVDGHMSKGQEMLAPWRPTTDWAQGGPIIELERIATWFERYDDEDAGLPCWFAAKYCEPEYQGPTPLVAAMRCYVIYKLGAEVEVPDELCVMEGGAR